MCSSRKDLQLLTDQPFRYYGKSYPAPSSDEKYQATDAAQDLDSEGNDLGNDQAFFGLLINADNDTRAPSPFSERRMLREILWYEYQAHSRQTN